MKARIEKKVCKRLVQVSPKLFEDAWKEASSEITELAHKQGSRVSGIYLIGGGLDYWGEGTDAETPLQFMRSHFHWIGKFPNYPEGHKFSNHPDTQGFKPTTRNLINLARKYCAQPKF
jgi:hypothetical protein